MPVCVMACTAVCVTGMDNAGLLHLATHMPQLLHLDVSQCSRITDGGLIRAREAAAKYSQHGMVITLMQSAFV